MPSYLLWYKYCGRVLTTRVVAHVSQGEEGDSKVVQKSLYHSAHFFFFLPFLQKAIQHCASTVTAQHRMIDMVLHDLHEN